MKLFHNACNSKKLILLFLMSICAFGAYAQSMSDNQVMELIVKEHSRGTSQAQIVTKLMQNGVNISQIRRVRSMYERMQKGSGLGTVPTEQQTDERSRRNNGQNRQGLTPDDIAKETRQMSDDELETASRYSNYRIRRHDDEESTVYDEYNEDFILMQDEMDDWLPIDTAAMYRQLVKQLQLDKKKKKVFGRDMFTNKNLSFEPNMNIATPQTYRLGPGDVVFVDIYGASQKSVQGTISPDGYLTIEGFGPVQIGGLTVSQANAQVKSQLGKRYSSSKIRLSVGQTRTITVNIMGEVKKPGTYTLSAFATVFNALYLAGGISDLGTLRNIKVYRNGTLISTIDAYDFILNGQSAGNVRLTDNDVISVGAYDCLVNISGKVKRPMYYEMKKNETMGSLLRYSGGFAGDAYTKSVRVMRKNGRQYSIYNVNEFDMSSFRIADGDSVLVDSVIPRYENMVELKGAVFRPGMYQVGDEINSVRSLIEAAEGVTEDAFTNHAVMHRMKANRTLEVISVDIEGILTGRVADIPLQSEDVLFVPTRQDVMEEQTLTIHGEVQYPGTYVYAENETLEDFILQAGGLKEAASTIKVDVSRRIINPSALTTDSLIARTYSFSLKEGFVIDGEPGFILAPFDEVYVRKSPGSTQQQSIIVDGEVMFSGTYTLTKRNARLSDAIKLAGGPTDMAYIKGARLERRTNETERTQMQESQRMAREQQQKNLLEMAASSQNAAAMTQVAQQNQNIALQRFNIPANYPVGIYLDKAIENPGSEYDIVLREGDRIVVPPYNGTVKINGAVMHSNTVGYVPKKGVNYYIDQAGGFSSDAKKRDTYIIYMNGTVAKVGHDAKVQPGCEIVVPTKAQSKMSMAEKLALGTGVTSIATMIATLANILK